MKASQCDECGHSTTKWYCYRGGEPFDVLTCGKGHKPRFYLPRSPLDFNFGWKKVCGDFMPSNAEIRGGEAVPLDCRFMPLVETENGNDRLQEHV